MMDIENFFKQDITKCCSTVLQNLYEEFSKVQYQQIVRKHTRVGKKKMGKKWVEEIRHNVPEVRIFEENRCVVFRFKNTYFESNGNYVWKKGERWITEMDMQYIDDLVAVLREIDEQIPLWNAEFLDLVKQYRLQLTEMERKRWRNHNLFRDFYNDWLLTKPKDLECEKIIFEKMQTEWQHLVTEERTADRQQMDGSVLKLSMHNFQITASKWTQSGSDYYTSHWELNGNDYGRTTNVISLEDLYELDALIPQWKRQFDEIECENQKRAKVILVAQAGINALVEPKMKEFGWEYKLEKGDEQCTLAVKLQKKRQVKVSFQYFTLSETTGNIVGKSAQKIELHLREPIHIFVFSTHSSHLEAVCLMISVENVFRKSSSDRHKKASIRTTCFAFSYIVIFGCKVNKLVLNRVVLSQIVYNS